MKTKTVFLITPPDNMVIPGETSKEFPAGPYLVIDESEFFYKITNGKREIKLHKDRFTHEAPKVEYLSTYEGNGLKSVVTKHRKGFAVAVKDIDSDQWVPTVKIWPTFDQADQDAKLKISTDHETD